MKTNNIIKLAKTSLLATALLVPAMNVLATTFTFGDPNSDVVVLDKARESGNYWITSRVSELSSHAASAEVGNGVLRAETIAAPYGGAIMAKETSELDFFTDEVTIRLEGITIESTGDGRFPSQGFKLGVASKLAFRQNSWNAYSNFGVGYYGDGGFLFSAANAYTKRNRLVPMQSVPSPYLNFDISSVSAVALTLNDTHYRLVFEFGNSLNAISFAGLHHLEKDLWRVSSNMRKYAINRRNALVNLAEAQAADPVDAAVVATAQANFDLIDDAYQTQWSIEEPIAGYSHLFIGAVSGDGEGAAITVDTLTIEPTSTLDVLKTP